ncbi:MAG: class I SAM-dependent methyltransferase [Clostridiales bacterium]|jgi:ubiquinone/menaquinone biosynthesis C-methylase UbiE|nr:class I SAM-dependent methyltransferase [Clostridiales bacterium]
MEIYNNFAYIYDALMEDVDYPGWVDYIERILKRYGVKPARIVDLACGTGNITILLKERGYHVIGVDQSEDMLSVAKEKAAKKGMDIPFIYQDMRFLELHGPVDAITCICDGINYILSFRDLNMVFRGVYRYLNPNGVFIFDISSYYKLSSILGNNIMVETDERISYIWLNYFDRRTSICEMSLSFFIKEGNYYRRFDEIHYQRAYRMEEIVQRLKKNGFKDIGVYQPFTFETPKKKAERIFFAARKV